MTTFQLDTSIRFGANALEALDKHRDQRVFLVTDPFLASTDLFRKARARLGSQVTVFDEVEPNPTVALVGRGTTCYLKADPEVVVALGGGSPIDAAKAMHQAALEVGRAAQHGLVVVPTTSGSGSEVTSFSVITDEVTHAKIAMVSPAMRPASARGNILMRCRASSRRCRLLKLRRCSGDRAAPRLAPLARSGFAAPWMLTPQTGES